MKDAVIVSTARTPIGKAYRGAFNDTEGPAMAGHAIKHAVARAGIDPAEIADVIHVTAPPATSPEFVKSRMQAPASSRVVACRTISSLSWSARSAPAASMPPKREAVCGVMPSCPNTGTPARTIALTAAGKSAAPSSFTRSAPASFTNRIAALTASSVLSWSGP